MRAHLLLAVIALTPAVVRADMSAKKPTSQADDVFGYMMTVIADNSEADAKSPVHGVRNFGASNTIVRSAVSYGILRAGGFQVAQDWAKNGQEIGSALAFFDAKNQANLESAFHKLFARTLVKKRAGAGDATRFSYDPAALTAAFDALYLPPTAALAGTRAQVVYDTLFQKWVATRAETIATALDRKGFLATAARELATKVNDPKFDGPTWQYALADKLPEPRDPRLLGTLVRRHADGTLPAVLQILRRVLKDYDPKTLQRLDARLHAPAA